MRISTILLTLLILGAGFGGWSVMRKFATKTSAAKKSEPVIAVSILPAALATHRPQVSLIGIIEAKDTASLTSPLDTEVIEVMVEEGDFIAKDAVLVKLDTRETGFTLEAQLASLDDINAQIEALRLDVHTERRRLREIKELVTLAREDLERSKTLHERGLLAKAAVNGAKSALTSRELDIIAASQRLNALNLSKKRLQASHRAAQAQVGNLRVLLERARIEAPFAGIVKSVSTSAGTRIGRGAPLAQMYNPETIRLRAAIPNEYATGKVVAALAGSITTPTGRVPVELTSIAPEAKAGRGTVDALFNLPDGEWLLGTAVEFDLLLPHVPASVAVPFDTLYSGNRVYIVDHENRAKAIECESAGQTKSPAGDSLLALLLCPNLREGDQMIINRIPNLISGSKLHVAEELT